MDNRSQHQSSATLWTLWILAVPLAYLLSVGPVVRLTMDRSHPLGVPVWVDTLYRPVEWLHDHTPLEKPLEWYMDWWLKGATPP
jgi:hypothetical protein